MKLISTLVFATRIVQFLYSLNPKFPVSSLLQCLNSPVCVGPVRQLHRWFSQEVAHFKLPLCSISLMHFSTTMGTGDLWALITVVKSAPNIDFTNLMSGIQSFGTFSEHFLWASKPQSTNKKKRIVGHWLCVTQIYARTSFYQSDILVVPKFRGIII